MMQFCELYRKQIHGWNQKRKNNMDMPSALPKTMKVKKANEGTDWQCQLFRNMRYTTYMLSAMKPFLDRLAMSQWIKGLQRLEDSSGGVTKKENKEKKREEDDDEAMEEDDFEPYHDDFKNFYVPMHLSAASLIISGPTAQSKYSYKMRVMQGKRKRIVRLNKGP